MTPSTTNLLREQASQAIIEIIKNVPSAFHLVPFYEFKHHTKLRSTRYNTFDVLCHTNTYKSTGWLVCRYVKTKGCTLKSGIMSFNTAAGGTGRLERHANSHTKSSSMRINLERPLPAFSKTKISRAAAIAVALDLRPLSFTENCEGMRHFVGAVFSAGQGTPVSDNIDPSSLMPSAKSVKESLKVLALDNREEYKNFLLDEMYKSGGGLTTDGVTLKVQDRQFIDLTVHYMKVTGTSRINAQPKVEMKVTTLLLKEKPEHGDASSIRAMLGASLNAHYNKDIDWMTKRFTMVTDCASVMARVALSSVSSRVAPMDEKWMGCFAHQLNTAMKCCIGSLSENQDLKNIFLDLQNVKKIVRIFKQSGWNGQLPSGFHLIQECETRFATTFSVVERFMKSAQKVKEIIEAKTSEGAKVAFENLEIEGDGTLVPFRFPCLQVISDAFEVLVETQTRVQAANTPTIHMALPLYQRCLDHLERLSDGGSIWRDDDSGWVPASWMCRKFCRNITEWLQAKVKVHHLWLVGCFLHPLLREFQFVNGVNKRQEYKMRAETVLRMLISSYRSEVGEGSGDTRLGSGGSAAAQRQSAQPGEGEAGGRKRAFSMLEYADSHFEPAAVVDEVSRYNAMDISILSLDRKLFMADDFAAIKFWYQRKDTYPSLYKAACRVFATPVSSCASERVFSALNRVVSRDRASTGSETLEDIVVVRSMLSQ